MSRYLLPGFMVTLFLFILIGINRGVWWATSFFSTESLLGFLAGCLACAGLYFVIQWLEPSGRDR